MYSPSVTDVTLPGAKTASSGGPPVVTFVAPSSGTWIVFVSCDYGGGSTEAYNYLASVKGATTPHAATASLAVARQNAKVTTSGALTVKVTCSGAPCSGTFKLTTRVKKATIVTIGSGSFSRLTLGAHSVSLKLNSTGLRTLRQNGYRLSSTATAMYMSGSKTKTAGAAVSLKGTKPKSKKR